MNGDPQAMLSVNKSIQTRVQNVEGNYSTLQQTATSLQTQINNTNNQYSQFRQTYDQFVLSINDGLSRTGIDITNHRITLTADNFFVKNNNNQNTLYLNSQGLVESRLGFITNPRTGNEETFYPIFYALSKERFNDDPLAYSFGLSGYNKAINGVPRINNDPFSSHYTNSVYINYFNFNAKQYDLTSNISYRIPELTLEQHDFTLTGDTDVQNYGSVSTRYKEKLSPKDGIACSWYGGGKPIYGYTQDLNGNNVVGILGWSGGTEKLVTFGPAGIIVKDATRDIVLNNNTLDEWITRNSTIWNSIPVGSMIRVKNYSSDRYSTLICKERN